MADYTRNNDVALDWDDVIEDDGQEFIILPEGDYEFEVVGFERGEFKGSSKMSPCNKVILTLQVTTDKGIANVRTDLIMNRVMEWRLSAFFRAIGLKKHGEKLKMDWSRVLEAKGRARFKPRTYMDNGNERQVNDVVRFYDPETPESKDMPLDDDLPFN